MNILRLAYLDVVLDQLLYMPGTLPRVCLPGQATDYEIPIHLRPSFDRDLN